MSFIYAIGDIHGYLEPLDEALKSIDLESDKSNQLILCGDYIDYGLDSCKTLYKLKELTEKYPNQVIVLMGNHEHMFMEFLNVEDDVLWNVEWLGADKGFSTVNSFISKETQVQIHKLTNESDYHDYLLSVSKLVKNEIKTNHMELVKWLAKSSLYYETETQIFVHAGIDEEAEEYWKYGTSDEYFFSKYPATIGGFYKDIIAGHVSTSSLTNDPEYHAVYWDGENHFFIDGETNISGSIPVLKYNTETSRYSSFTKMVSTDGNELWNEYLIK